MGGTTGTHLPLNILLTREVRWFYEGAVPDPVHQWFTASETLGSSEQRIDHYDVVSAGLGVGRKRRAGGSAADSKVRFFCRQSVWLEEGLVGQVEDWAKISCSAPPGDGLKTDVGEIEVNKEIITRRFVMPGTSDLPEGPSGCEAELAEIRVGDLVAWTVCFETFGPSELRHHAFRTGIDRFVEETPLPDDLRFTAVQSAGYPEWLAGLVTRSEALA